MELRDEFPMPSREEVLAVIGRELKGKPYSDLFQQREGFAVAPLAPENTPTYHPQVPGTWISGVFLHHFQGKDLEKALQTASQYAAKAIVLNQPAPSTKTDLITLLQGEDGKLGGSFKDSEGHLRNLAVDAAIWKQSGASVIQQLAAAWSEGHDLLTTHAEEVAATVSINNRIWFHLTSGPHYLEEIAALRAFRKGWETITSNYAGKPLKAMVVASTNPRWLADRDTYTNLLRLTTQAISSIIGTADIVLLHSLDHHQDNPGHFATRLSMNIHHLLREESMLHYHQDPAAGAHYIDHLTELIFEKAWEFFIQLEEKGGSSTSEGRTYLESAVQENHRNQEQQLREGKLVLTGINKYQDKRETRQTTGKSSSLAGIIEQ